MIRNMINKLSIGEISKIFGSKTKAQEIILLLDGLKPVVRQGFYADELPLLLEFCNKHRINIVRSRFTIKISDHDQDFSNKGITSDSGGMFFIYLSKDRGLADQAALFEEKQDYESLGRLLGYPECCIRFFCKEFSANNFDLQRLSDNPYTNLSLRSQDYVILSHFPCSPDCKKSIDLAKRYVEAMKRHDPEYAKNLLDKLS